MVRLLMSEKPKLSFDLASRTIKTNKELSGKEMEKYPRHFQKLPYWLDGYLGIDDWDFTPFEQCETQLTKKGGNHLAAPT